MRVGHRRTAVLAAAAIAIALGACSGGQRPTLTSIRAPTASPSPVRQAAPLKTPKFGKAPLPDPAAAPGQLVVVTDTQVRPALLVSTVELPVVWENRSDTPVEVHMNAGIDSGIVEPGTSFSYTPDAAVALAYDVRSGDQTWDAVVQVEAPLMPGETPWKRPPKNYPNLNWPYISPTPSPSPGSKA